MKKEPEVWHVEFYTHDEELVILSCSYNLVSIIITLDIFEKLKNLIINNVEDELVSLRLAFNKTYDLRITNVRMLIQEEHVTKLKDMFLSLNKGEQQ